MPTGVYVRRKFSNNFRPEVSEKYIDSYVWMDYIMERDQIFIKHKLNNQHEVRFGNYLVNGYCIGTKTVYAFNGCYYHHCPHNCFRVKNQSINQLSRCLISVSTDSKAHHPIRKA